MKRLALLATILLFCSPVGVCTTLKEMYDAARPGSGYDKFIQLQTGIVYTGGLYIGKTFNRINAQFEGDDEIDVFIKGNGAIIDLRGGEICISYCTDRLDIEDCVIINGNVRFRGMEDGPIEIKPTGSVRHVTFYKPHDYAIRIIGCGDNITVERNIFVDTQETGPDFMGWSGYLNDWLATGAGLAFSAQGYGFPWPVDNWSYHSDPAANADPLRHFTLLCEYG